MTSAEKTLTVRQITDVHSNWSAQGDDAQGKFSFQLILDDGAEEVVIRPPADDSFVVLQLLAATSSLFFDTQNRVLIFGKIALAAVPVAGAAAASRNGASA